MASYSIQGNTDERTESGVTYKIRVYGHYTTTDYPTYVHIAYTEYLVAGIGGTSATKYLGGTYKANHNGSAYNNTTVWAISSGTREIKMQDSSINVTKTTSAQTALFTLQYTSNHERDFPTAESSGSLSIPIPALAKYTVSFSANGHGTAPSSQSIYYGGKATQPTSPTASGYTFKGWYKEAACTNAWSFSSDTVTANTTLYAKWVANKYTITYNGNGNTSGSISTTLTKSYNNSVDLHDISTFSLAKTGYHVNSGAEWNKAANGSGTSYSQSTSYAWTTFGSLTAEQTNVTLYANWKVNTYTVTYNANGGTGAPANQTKTYNVALTLSTTKPTRTGYTFSNWTASTGGNWNAGASFTGNGASHGATITMTANWTANTYTISYDANGGSGSVASQTKAYNASATLASSGYTRKGTLNGAPTEYTLIGWNTKADGTGTSYSLGGTVAANTITANLKLYAVWRLDYVYPTISGFDVIRTATNSISDDTEVDDGKYLLVTFGYTNYSDDGGTTYKTPSLVLTIDGTNYTPTLSGNSFTYKNSTEYSDDEAHTVSVRIYDPNHTASNATASELIPTAILPIDLYSGNDGVYMGIMHPYVDGQDVTMPDLYLDNLFMEEDTDLYNAIVSLGWQNDVIV